MCALGKGGVECALGRQVLNLCSWERGGMNSCACEMGDASCAWETGDDFVLQEIATADLCRALCSGRGA